MVSYHGYEHLPHPGLEAKLCLAGYGRHNGFCASFIARLLRQDCWAMPDKRSVDDISVSIPYNQPS
ncbi:UNVERIFIED_CONTAM: hypothetical protein Sradi_5757500 [Sesamum radiatum]|uniref:Uncharacterized protein n=1 Tax=Sesamum radiatum TaxID=300843 RepID=A0AAW2L585_SESRA